MVSFVVYYPQNNVLLQQTLDSIKNAYPDNEIVLITENDMNKASNRQKDYVTGTISDGSYATLPIMENIRNRCSGDYLFFLNAGDEIVQSTRDTAKEVLDKEKPDLLFVAEQLFNRESSAFAGVSYLRIAQKKPNQSDLILDLLAKGSFFQTYKYALIKKEFFFSLNLAPLQSDFQLLFALIAQSKNTQIDNNMVIRRGVPPFDKPTEPEDYFFLFKALKAKGDLPKDVSLSLSDSFNRDAVRLMRSSMKAGLVAFKNEKTRIKEISHSFKKEGLKMPALLSWPLADTFFTTLNNKFLSIQDDIFLKKQAHFNAKRYWKWKLRLHSKHPLIRWISFSITDRIEKKSNGYIGFNASLNGTILLQHGLSGVFISTFAAIGRNCTIYEGACLISVGTPGSKLFGAPIIGNNVLIGANSTIVGRVTIGDNAKIGAGATITKNVPSGATAIGFNQIFPKKEETI